MKVLCLNLHHNAMIIKGRYCGTCIKGPFFCNISSTVTAAAMYMLFVEP